MSRRLPSFPFIRLLSINSNLSAALYKQAVNEWNKSFLSFLAFIMFQSEFHFTHFVINYKTIFIVVIAELKFEQRRKERKIANTNYLNKFSNAPFNVHSWELSYVPWKILIILCSIAFFFFPFLLLVAQQSYATLGRNNKNSITTCTASSSVYTSSPLGSPINQQLGGPSVNIPHPMSVGLISPNQSIVTSTLNEFRFRPELLANSNRLQESCI